MVNERFIVFTRTLGFLASSPDLPDNFSVLNYWLTLTSTSSGKIRAKSRPYRDEVLNNILLSTRTVGSHGATEDHEKKSVRGNLRIFCESRRRHTWRTFVTAVTAFVIRLAQSERTQQGPAGASPAQWRKRCLLMKSVTWTRAATLPAPSRFASRVNCAPRSWRMP